MARPIATGRVDRSAVCTSHQQISAPLAVQSTCGARMGYREYNVAAAGPNWHFLEATSL